MPVMSELYGVAVNRDRRDELGLHPVTSARAAVIHVNRILSPVRVCQSVSLICIHVINRHLAVGQLTGPTKDWKG